MRTAGGRRGSPLDAPTGGCELKVDGLVCVRSNPGRPEKEVPEQVVLTFLCRGGGGEPRADEECSDAPLLPSDEPVRLVYRRYDG